jgi:DNA-binding MarR family transcriptional regulator
MAPAAPSPSPVEEQRAEVMNELFAVVPLLQRYMAEGLKRRRLTQPRARLLGILSADGPKIMHELANALDITPRGVTTLVDGLEASGLVARTHQPHDRRVTVVGLTAKGRRACHEMQVGYQRWANDLLDGFDGAELEVSRQVLIELRTNLEKLRTQR